MADQDTPNTSKAEGERWSAEETSATRRAENSDVAGNYRDENDDAGGITNRSLDEERDNQDALPNRGTSRDERRSER